MGLKFKIIDKELSKSLEGLNRLTETLFERDSENKKYRVIKKIKKNICKNFINKKKRFVISNPRRIRIFAVCHPNELHFALGLCRKCYWKQYRDNAPPAICHPNKKIFRKNLCKPCYRKLHPEKKINEN